MPLASSLEAMQFSAHRFPYVKDCLIYSFFMKVNISHLKQNVYRCKRGRLNRRSSIREMQTENSFSTNVNRGNPESPGKERSLGPLGFHGNQEVKESTNPCFPFLSYQHTMEDNRCEHYHAIFTSQNSADLGLLLNSNMSGIIIQRERLYIHLEASGKCSPIIT